MNIKDNTETLGNGITLIDSGYQQGDVAVLYLMEQKGKCAIIETGTAHSVPFILEVLTSKGLSPDDVLFVIPTHVHLDHAGGAGELMHQCKNAQLVIHPFGARHMIDPSKLEAGTKAVYGEEQFKKLYGSLRSIDADRVIETVFDEQKRFKLDFNGRSLEFLDTPGHAKHHFCVYDKLSEGVFTGDTFGLSYPDLQANPDSKSVSEKAPFIFATTTPVQFDPEALLSSIDSLVALNAKQMFLTHFGAICPTPEVVKQLKKSVKVFSDIALESKDCQEDRVTVIKQKIKIYLLDELEKHGCKQERSVCEKVIETDTLLNAQGLDFWLSRYH